MTVLLVAFNKWFRISACSIIICLFLSIIFFSAVYFFSTYDWLSKWYESLNNCFYKHETWTDNFFTHQVKATGNYLAIAGITLSLFSIVYILSRWKTIIAATYLRKTKIAIVPYAVVIVLAVIFNLWGKSFTAPAYDEVFSAVNCAKLHPFQTISYYMLPNNHLYFNLMNRFFGGWCTDLVQSGRLISLFAYIGVLIFSFYFLSSFIKNNWVSIIAILPVALQFTVWAFGFQARGYEWQLLAGWVSFITIFYYAQYDRDDLLWLNTVSNIAGFVLIPSYLFWYLAQIIFIVIVKLKHKNAGIKILKHQLVLVAFVFLFYLPALCFSGIQSFTANKYVKPHNGNLHTFYSDFINIFKYYLSICFSCSNSIVNFIFFLLPLILFFSKRTEQRLLALLYIILWLVFVIICFTTRNLPFDRNLIIHFSLTAALEVYTWYVVIQTALYRLNIQKTKHTFVYSLFLIAIFFASWVLLKHDRNNISNLYGNKLNETYSEHKKELVLFPANSSIAFSYESFYLYYLCHNEHHFSCSRCTAGNEDYYVKRTDEELPVAFKDNYLLFKTCSEDYEIYKRK